LLIARTRDVGEDAMKILAESPFELIINKDNAEPPREWVLKQLADPEVHGACIMHSQGSDKVDKEFLDACNPNLKVISTFSVGYGKSLCHGSRSLANERPH
jgi:glyoxylate/hydroxypyruvate reductase